ncbi:MAG: glycosyltransferase family 10 [Verrucomicrobia bacterium]|nr:glycosyltransferase family 10 [Verrucomicrobiota bacterium]
MPAAPIAPRLRVAVTTTVGHAGLEALCPKRILSWGHCDFLLNPPRGTACDYWIVFAGSRDRDRLVCAPENTLFIAGEPPAKKIYPQAFYAQFHRVVSTHAADPHPRVTTSLPGLNWHVGLDRKEDRYHYGYDELKTLMPGPKSDTISVVCSNLTTTAGQRERLRFLDQLRAALGDQLVHYGRGFTPIPDKMDAILPHRYHLVLENSRSPDYWTEKLSDAYLGWAHPIYVGCPNLADYFPAAGFTAVEVTEPAAALAIIRAKLRQWPAHEVLARCRDLVLDTYNPFARFAHWAERFHQPERSPQPLSITTHKAFRPFPGGLLYRLKTRV